MGFLLRLLRRITLGKPIPTWLAMHQRLPKFLALPIFASDAMSSVAYATDEIILVLALAGTGALNNVPWVAVAIVVLLAIVVTSYRQTIFAYPSGGGSYIVARDNLGVTFGLIAAASILTDYVLTVAVSIASGVLNIISAYPMLRPHLVWMCLGAIALVAIANLRGLKESGTLFAGPAYAYILSFLIMIIGGFVKWRMGTLHPAIPTQATPALQGLTVFLVLRAFAGGCSAMTGTEAVADGVPAFRPPESKNAAATLVYMALVLGTLFLGISVLAHILGISSVREQTVISQIAGAVFGRTRMYFAIQIVTMLILVLAAQTSFADFPRLSSILARDRFMPRQLANIGDRLVFQNGIVALWVLASVLIIVFQGDVHKLIPLYAIGVFMSFTLSQAGMVVHTRRLKERNWRLRVAISTVGAATTALVVVVAAVAKAAEGAWIVIILVPLLVLVFRRINTHYNTLADQLRLPAGEPSELPEMKNTVLVLVPGVHRGILPALQYAKSLSPDCRGVYIETDPADTPLIEERWEKWGMGIPLVVLESPFRSVVQPILKYLDEVKKDRVRHVVTVVIPEFVPARFWHKIMHNQSGIMLKFALLFKKDIVVTNVRYYLEK